MLKILRSKSRLLLIIIGHFGPWFDQSFQHNVAEKVDDADPSQPSPFLREEPVTGQRHNFRLPTHHYTSENYMVNLLSSFLPLIKHLLIP